MEPEGRDRVDSSELSAESLARAFHDIESCVGQQQADQCLVRIHCRDLHALVEGVTALRKEVSAARQAAEAASVESVWRRAQFDRSDQLRREMLTSTSWRITAPLRTLSAARRGLARAIGRGAPVDEPAFGRRAPPAKSNASADDRNSSSVRGPETDGDVCPLTTDSQVGPVEPLPKQFVGEPRVFAVRRIGSEQRADADASGRNLLCITHILPHQPRAGNEYRVNRLLSWAKAHGFRVTLIVCPLPDVQVTDDVFVAASGEFAQLILVGRDGQVTHNLADDSSVIARLRGGTVREDLKKVLGEDDGGVDDPLPVNFMTHYCPDVLVEIAAHVDAAINFDVVLAEYVFMTRPFPLLRSGSLKVVDTHDVLSTLAEKVGTHAINGVDGLDNRGESLMLERADIIIGIQPEESKLLENLYLIGM